MTSQAKINPKKYISPFASKMKILAITVALCGMFVGAPIIFSSGGKPLTTFSFVICQIITISVWFYLSAILFQFYRRTRLREYILTTHTFWLAGIIAYPLSAILNGILRLIQNLIQPNLLTTLFFLLAWLWFILSVIGKVISQMRGELFKSEVQANKATWKELLSMNYRKIAFLNFPQKL